MRSHTNARSNAFLRLLLVVAIAAMLALSAPLPGSAEGTGGGGNPPDTPPDTTIDGGGTNSADDGSTAPFAEEQGGIDVSWAWTIDLLVLTTSTIL